MPLENIPRRRLREYIGLDLWRARAHLLLVVAVSLRTVDLALCGIWPWGTHFLWHMLNAAVLYLSAHALRKQAV